MDLILADHRLFEDLLHLLRDITQDRVAVRVSLADVLAAHAIAEERHVYPTLAGRHAIDEDEVEHSTREHLDVSEKLLALLEVPDPRSEDFDAAVEDLTRALAHHLDEEEREILNPARTEVDADVKADLGRRFAEERNRQIDARAGEPDSLRRLIAEERKRASPGPP